MSATGHTTNGLLMLTITPGQAELVLLSVRQFVDDPEFMGQFLAGDKSEFEQLELALAAAIEGD